MVRVNPSAQAGSRSVLVYLRLDRSAGFRQGLFAQGTHRRRAAPTTLALPLSAVRTDKPAPYVQMVIERTHRAPRGRDRPARPGSTARRMVAVSGIDDGAVVVAGSVGPLREGTAVRLAPVAPRRAARTAP